MFFVAFCLWWRGKKASQSSESKVTEKFYSGILHTSATPVIALDRINAFKKAGLAVTEEREMSKDDFGMAPMNQMMFVVDHEDFSGER